MKYPLQSSTRYFKTFFEPYLRATYMELIVVLQGWQHYVSKLISTRDVQNAFQNFLNAPGTWIYRKILHLCDWNFKKYFMDPIWGPWIFEQISNNTSGFKAILPWPLYRGHGCEKVNELCQFDGINTSKMCNYVL